MFGQVFLGSLKKLLAYFLRNFPQEIYQDLSQKNKIALYFMY